MKFYCVLHDRQRDDGTHPVYLRLRLPGKYRYFPLNLYCLPSQWDEAAHRFRKSYHDHREANALLLSYEKRAADYLRGIAHDNALFSLEQFEAAVFGSHVAALSQNIAQTCLEISATIARDGGLGNSVLYRTAGNLISAYAPNAALSDLSAEWLHKFERYLRKERGNSDGGASATLRTLRAVCNRVRRLPGVPADWQPFAAYRIKKVERSGGLRALSLDDVRKLEQAEVSKESERLARDLFLLSFYLRGMNLADLARLTSKNIVAGRIEYVRQKTGKAYSIAISEPVAAILARYAGGPYLLPILRPDMTEKQKRVRIGHLTRSLNIGIRSVAASCGIDTTNLIFYSARHTYATALKLRGASVEVISEALGHSDLKTTEGYLARFERGVLDAADALLR